MPARYATIVIIIVIIISSAIKFVSRSSKSPIHRGTCSYRSRLREHFNARTVPHLVSHGHTRHPAHKLSPPHTLAEARDVENLEQEPAPTRHLPSASHAPRPYRGYGVYEHV